jgi:hypothetical protein
MTPAEQRQVLAEVATDPDLSPRARQVLAIVVLLPEGADWPEGGWPPLAEDDWDEAGRWLVRHGA